LYKFCRMCRQILLLSCSCPCFRPKTRGLWEFLLKIKIRPSYSTSILYILPFHRPTPPGRAGLSSGWQSCKACSSFKVKRLWVETRNRNVNAPVCENGIERCAAYAPKNKPTKKGRRSHLRTATTPATCLLNTELDLVGVGQR